MWGGSGRGALGRVTRCWAMGGRGLYDKMGWVVRGGGGGLCGKGGGSGGCGRLRGCRRALRPAGGAVRRWRRAGAAGGSVSRSCPALQEGPRSPRREPRREGPGRAQRDPTGPDGTQRGRTGLSGTGPSGAAQTAAGDGGSGPGPAGRGEARPGPGLAGGPAPGRGGAGRGCLGGVMGPRVEVGGGLRSAGDWGPPRDRGNGGGAVVVPGGKGGWGPQRDGGVTVLLRGQELGSPKGCGRQG